MRSILIRWIWIPLFLLSGVLLLTIHTDGGLLELVMISPAMAGTVLFVSAHSQRSDDQQQFSDMSMADRLLFATACFLAAVGLGLGRWKNPYLQYYLHRFDPVETAIILCVGIGALVWVVNNAPISKGD